MVFAIVKMGHVLSVEKWYESTEPMVKLNDMNQRPKIQGRVFAITGQSDEETKSGTISLFFSY